MGRARCLGTERSRERWVSPLLPAFARGPDLKTARGIPIDNRLLGVIRVRRWCGALRSGTRLAGLRLTQERARSRYRGEEHFNLLLDKARELQRRHGLDGDVHLLVDLQKQS